jgi:hypothetical protein
MNFLIFSVLTFVYAAKDPPAQPVIPQLVPVSQDEVQTLRNYAIFCSIASCPSDSILKWNCGPLCQALPVSKVLGYFSNDFTDAGGYVAEQIVDAEQGRNLIVSFRASRSLENWINNLKFFQQQFPWKSLRPNIFVHKGFFETYLSILTQIAPLVAKGAQNVMRVIFTGHSLGGALATLAMVDFVQQGILPANFVQLVTFGSPRVGNPEWSQYFQSTFEQWQTIRVVNQRDIVPHLPPMNIPDLPYNQIIQEWYWPPEDSGAKGFKCSATNPEDLQCSDGTYFNYSVEDHLFFQDIIFGCGKDYL